MSSTGTKRSRNRGTASTSQDQTYKKNTRSSARNTEKISKYFTKVARNEDSDNSSELSDSPYKNCLNDVKNVKLDNSSSELDDFKTPKAINKVSKIVNSKPAPNNAKTKRKKTRQPPLRKFVEDNFKHLDVHPDHLQMALALSESSYEAENPNTTPSSQEKMTSFKEAFEKYGFGYSKNKLSVQHKREVSESKKNKKSRFRYITPTLKIRTEEERQNLISSKVSLILAQNRGKYHQNTTQPPLELFCECLEKCRNLWFFKLNRSELDELNYSDKFYVPGLDVGRCLAPCGRLLKDWRRIPGREPTPERLNNLATPSDSASSIIKPLETSVNLTPPRGVANIDDKIATPTEFSPICSPVEIDESQIFSSDTYGDFIEQNDSSKNRNSCGVISPLEDLTNYENSESPVLDMGEITTHGISSMSRLSLEINSPNLEESHKSRQRSKSPQKTVTDFSLNISMSVEEVSCPLRLRISPNRENSRHGTKRSFDCVSPDLFESDDDQFPQPLNNFESGTPILNRLRGGLSKKSVEIECFDLTQSEEDEKEEMKSIPRETFQIRLSELGDSIDRRSDLNITDYVADLLSNYKEEAPTNSKVEEISSSEEEEEESQRSQSQSSVYISDDELNYSSVMSTPHPKKKVEYDFSEDEEFSSLAVQASLTERIKQKSKTEEISDSDKTLPYNYQNEDLPPPDNSPNKPSPPLALKKSSLEDHKNDRIRVLNEILPPDIFRKTPNKTPQAPTLEDSFNNALSEIPPNDTPNTSGFFIKTKNVTPMANYDEMDTPKIVKELDKFGLKPVKRQKGVKLLRYIYESTHPVVGDENRRVRENLVNLPQMGEVIMGEVGEVIVGEVGDGEDFVFERKQSKKIASCAVPLHIVWHNFVMSNPKIRECILLYEPLQLEVLHSMLKDQGFKFNIQDLLSFLDKKCITIRTAQGQHQRKKSK